MKKIAVIVVVVVLIGIVYMLGGKGTAKSAEYKNEPTGVSFQYPSKFTSEEKNVNNDVMQPGVILTSGTEKIAIAIQVKPKVDAQIENAYYKASFAADPIKKVSSSEVTIGGFVGHKVLFDFTKSQYFLFKEGAATSTLVLQVELNAGTADKLLELENTLRDILTSVSFTK